MPRALLPDLPSPSPLRAANNNRGASTPRDSRDVTSSCCDALDEISPEIEISSAPDTTVPPPGDAGGAYTPPPQHLLTRARSRDTPSPAAEVKTSRTPLDHERMCPREGRQVRAPQTPPDHELPYEEEDTCMSVICGGGCMSPTPPDHDRTYPSPLPEVMALYAARTTPPPPAPILASASQKFSI